MTASEAGGHSRTRVDLGDEEVPSWLRWASFGALVVVALSRAPYLLTRGRFWAEEGDLHFAHAYTEPFPSELFFVQRRTGYYNLYANVSSSTASAVPLLQAPLVTAWLSLGVVALLLWVLLFWPSDLLTVAGAKIAAAALLLVGTLAIPEVWLNTINAQTYLGLVALVLLFVRVDELSTGRFVSGVVLLGVAGLSGFYAVALAPLFVVVALLDGTFRRWAYAVPLVVAGALQTIVLIWFRVSGEIEGSKLALPQLGELFRSVVRGQLGGLVLGSWFGDLVDLVEDGSIGAAAVAAVLVLAVVATLALVLWFAPNRRVTLLLVGALALVELVVQIGSFGAAVGRYTVVPIGILLLMLVYGVAASWGRWFAWAGVGALALAAVAGIGQYWTSEPRYLRCIDCPEWADEVERHEAGDESLLIWPYDRDEPWEMELPLPDRDR